LRGGGGGVRNEKLHKVVTMHPYITIAPEYIWDKVSHKQLRRGCQFQLLLWVQIYIMYRMGIDLVWSLESPKVFERRGVTLRVAYVVSALYEHPYLKLKY
jgi:hypothetical protein